MFLFVWYRADFDFPYCFGTDATDDNNLWNSGKPVKRSKRWAGNWSYCFSLLGQTTAVFWNVNHSTLSNDYTFNYFLSNMNCGIFLLSSKYHSADCEKDLLCILQNNVSCQVMIIFNIYKSAEYFRDKNVKIIILIVTYDRLFCRSSSSKSRDFQFTKIQD